MSKKIYVDAVHPEETRVVVVDTATGRVSDFDVETTTKPQIKGNIYLAKVIRVEPSLQAAFVDYGTGIILITLIFLLLNTTAVILLT